MKSGTREIAIEVVEEDQKLFLNFILSVILTPNQLITHMVKFIEDTITNKFLDSRPVYISDVHKYSSPYSPIVFHLTASVEEPSSDLTKLADLQGIASSKVKYLALSRDNTEMAMSLLETAFIRGQWIIFQNIHLVPYFLPQLEKQINEKDKEDIHEDFRVWMTWCSQEVPAFTLIQKSVLLFCEPSRDIR